MVKAEVSVLKTYPLEKSDAAHDKTLANQRLLCATPVANQRLLCAMPVVSQRLLCTT